MNDEAEILAYLKDRKAAKQRAEQIVEPRPNDIGETIRAKTGLKKVKPGWLQKSIAEANRKASEPEPTLVWSASKNAWVKSDGTVVVDIQEANNDKQWLSLVLNDWECHVNDSPLFATVFSKSRATQYVKDFGYQKTIDYMQDLADDFWYEEDWDNDY